MFAKIPLANLAELCRALRHSLGAGLTLRDVFRQQLERGPSSVRPVAARMRSSLDQGESLAVALEQERRAFPPLFLALASVGEETGNLPEIFGELEKYYALQVKLRRQLISQSILPVLQLSFAFVVVAFLIWILSVIAQSRNSTPITIFGLSGAGGAMVFLALTFGSIAALVVLYLVVTRWFQQKPTFDALLLWVPALGPCIEALVLGRFALALRLTMETGMPIQRAIRLSFEATGNAAYASYAGVVNQALKAGETLTTALTRCRLFPGAFLNMIAVGEEGGRVPEIMSHQADFYFEEAARRLTTLTKMTTFGIWCLYAVVMVIMIFRIANIYFSALSGK
jgi:type II secretory pathway component PulF